MKYIRNRQLFFLNENKKQSKSIVNKLNKEDIKIIVNLFFMEADKLDEETKKELKEGGFVDSNGSYFYKKSFEYIYDKLIKLCESKPNLLGIFTNFLFVDKIPFNNLIDLMKDIESINLSDLPKDILKYNSKGVYEEEEIEPFEKLNDDILIVKKKYKLRKFRQNLNSNQKKEFDEITDYKEYELEDNTTIDILNIVNDFSSKYPLSMIKVSKYDTFQELMQFVFLLTLKDTKDIDTLKYELKQDGIEVMDRDDNLVVARILTYEDSNKYGSENWCISYDERYFSSYVLSKVWNRQYFIWNYDKLGTNLFMTGVTVNLEIYDMDNFTDFLSNVTAHDEYDYEIQDTKEEDLGYLNKLFNEGVFNIDAKGVLSACDNKKENYIIEHEYDDGYENDIHSLDYIDDNNGLFTAHNRFSNEEEMMVTNINNIPKVYNDIADTLYEVYTYDFLKAIHEIEVAIEFDMDDFLNKLQKETGITPNINNISQWASGDFDEDYVASISDIYRYEDEIATKDKIHKTKFILFSADYITDKINIDNIDIDIHIKDYIIQLNRLSDLLNRGRLEEKFINSNGFHLMDVVKESYVRIYVFSSGNLKLDSDKLSRDIIGDDKFIIFTGY